jgi:transposase
MCLDRGVRLIYLLPYLPDLNPIEEFFSELKQYIKRKWNEYDVNLSQGFDNFLEWCVDAIGLRVSSAEGYFRNIGLKIEEL